MASVAVPSTESRTIVLCLEQQDGEAVDRQEFEYLRDLPDKQIAGDIILKPKKANSPVLASGAVQILNAAGVSANMHIEVNSAIDSKTINVMVVGVGAVCRLEVDAREHPPFGRSHKHALKTPDCPEQGLHEDMSDQSRLSGRSISEVLAEFCRAANIRFEGQLRE